MMVRIMTEIDAKEFALEWIGAWNARDLEAILSHYADDVVLVSPAAAKILNSSSGQVEGKTALRSYFQRGLDAYPNLRFELLDVLCGLSSVVLYYNNQKGTRTAEFMEVGAGRKITRVVANYSV